MAGYCLGVDLGGTFIKYIMLGEDLSRGPVSQVPTPQSGGGRAVVEQMVCGAKQAMEQAGLRLADVRAVGIGAPGPLKIAEGVVVAMPNIPGMENLPLARLVGEGLGIPAVLENDANAAGYGEFLCGAGRDGGDMVLLTLGTGVGSGIVVNRKVLHGAHDIGAEIGHMIIVPDGQECGCGQRGCLERYCSATFIARLATKRMQETGHKGLLADVLKRKGSIDARDIVEAAAAGDSLARDAWDKSTYYLALGCVNICRIFDPVRIVFAGGMTKAGDALLNPVRRHFEDLHWKIARPVTELAIAQLGNDAGAIGAAGVAWNAVRK